MTMNNRIHTIPPAARPQKLTLGITISNGNPVNDTRLRFDFISPESRPEVWLARLPILRNADAFPHQLSPSRWELTLDAVAETQPLEVVSYCPENADQWLEAADWPRPPHTELLVMVCHNQFNITVLEHK